MIQNINDDKIYDISDDVDCFYVPKNPRVY